MLQFLSTRAIEQNQCGKRKKRGTGKYYLVFFLLLTLFHEITNLVFLGNPFHV